MSGQPTTHDLLSGDWKKIAREAWEAPSWREAAIAYHKDRSASPAPSAGKLMPSERQIWRAAGQCVRRKAAHDALRDFLEWCDRNDVDRNDALPMGLAWPARRHSAACRMRRGVVVICR